MTVLQNPTYDSHHRPYIANTSMTTDQDVQQQSPPGDEQYITTFFCRALYDYQTQDSSSLSFQRNDIIEVLTRLESGWWDGLLGDERGWFPSNYVTMISDEEAEMALSASEYSMQQVSEIDSITDESDSTATALQSGLNGGDWLNGDMGHLNSHSGLVELANATLEESATLSDFWMPQVTPEGIIYYVNTQTGQISRDLPMETDDEASDNDVTGLTTPQTTSRAGTSVGLSAALPSVAGFGISRHPEMPEPWMRRLADDGMSYYFVNQETGEIRWTAPELNTSREDLSTKSFTTSSHDHNTLEPNRLRSDSSASDLQQRDESSINRRSFCSDDSGACVLDEEHTGSLPSNQEASSNGHNELDWACTSSPERADINHSLVELTSAERSAQSLQQALSPSTPQPVADLSATAREAIMTVIRGIQATNFANLDDSMTLDNLVQGVVVAIRNFLYVSAAPSGHIPSHVIPGPREARARRDTTASETLLKPAQRRVTATLSKLVLSARAIQYNSGSSVAETSMRLGGDAEELERAVVTFITEVQRSQSTQLHSPTTLKRLHGVFSTTHIGLGLMGAGAAGSWKGLGWVSLVETDEAPGRIFGTEVVTELKTYVSQVQEMFITFGSNLKEPTDKSAKGLHKESQSLIAQLSSLLIFVANIHIARHVDIDGIRRESGDSPNGDLYTQTVEKARLLVRSLEVAMQSLYDDGSHLLTTTQTTRLPEKGRSSQGNDFCDLIDKLIIALRANLSILQHNIEALLSIGHDQADMAQGDYNGSIEWRMSRLSVIDTRFGGAFRPMPTLNPYDRQGDDVVDMELALQKPEMKTQASVDSSTIYHNDSVASLPTLSERTQASDAARPTAASADTSMLTLVSLHSPVDLAVGRHSSQLFDEDPTASSRLPPRGDKLKKILGPDAPQHYLNLANAEAKPWYLRPTYNEKEILIDPDGTVRGGTVAALVERLTAHEHGDPTFIKTFLMTYKSFTNLDDLFDLLVKRFWIQPPDSLNPLELEEWGKLKQHVIQMRVINTFKSMVVDDDILEKEDMYILNRIKEFISGEEVNKFAAAKQLLIQIDRAQQGGDTRVKTTISTTLQAPPPPINPKSTKKLKLLDIDSLELARQLTILESQLYQKIRPMECLQRSREQKTDHNDNIAAVIQTSNRIANWVADSVLNKEDSRRRAAVVKQFISVADRCRGLHNFSSMVAIISGLNSPPIRRLKRTWEQISTRYMNQLGACEMTIDSNKNFTNYRTTLAKISPPCVPFIGVFLTTLTFVQDGSKDALPGNLINFRKRQKASEVIQDIKRWQSHPHNFQPLPAVLMYIEDSLHQFNDQVDIGDLFWNLSLEREPREREDEKMARLLQESGFL